MCRSTTIRSAASTGPSPLIPPSCARISTLPEPAEGGTGRDEPGTGGRAGTRAVTRRADHQNPPGGRWTRPAFVDRAHVRQRQRLHNLRAGPGGDRRPAPRSGSSSVPAAAAVAQPPPCTESAHTRRVPPLACSTRCDNSAALSASPCSAVSSSMPPRPATPPRPPPRSSSLLRWPRPWCFRGGVPRPRARISPSFPMPRPGDSFGAEGRHDEVIVSTFLLDRDVTFHPVGHPCHSGGGRGPRSELRGWGR
jgi:hypothetical protein